MNSSSAGFYVNLPVLEHFFDASDPDNYHALPDDWYLAVTDIENSTGAIRQNRYKSVNMLGAAPLAGMLNQADRNSIPFIFGGDGAMMALPAHLYDSAREILASCRKIGTEAYGLHLRAALIPVSVLRDEGKEVHVARFKVSEYYVQALFRGPGIRYAEELLKSPDRSQFQVPIAETAASVDFSGLECRWKEVRSAQNEVVTLLACTNPELENDQAIYSGVLNTLNKIYGPDEKINPVSPGSLQMSLSVSQVMTEVNIRTFSVNLFQKLVYLLKTQVQILVGKLFMKVGFHSSETDWSRYKPDLSSNSDYRKFDDMIRIVISGTAEQRQRLERYLEQQFDDGKLAYGLHVTDSAIITCMVFSYQHEHIHFVDGSNGGYVMAARQIKARLKELAT